MKIGIGTAQFGLNYGISNRTGQVTEQGASEILTAADDMGVQYIDTAKLYGDSERVLGSVLPIDHRYRIITKTIKLGGKNIKKSSGDAGSLKDEFFRSLQIMKQTTVYGLLMHDADDLLADGGPFLYESLSELKRQGKVEKIGVSIYDASQIDRILELYPIDIVQLPINVFDQRLLESGHLKKLKQKGVEIHARSAFLQGLLLMEMEEIPPFFQPIMPQFQRWKLMLEKLQMSPLQGALAFMRSLEEVSVVICGITGIDQLTEIVQSASISMPDFDFSDLAVRSEQYINPSMWKIG